MNKEDNYILSIDTSGGNCILSLSNQENSFFQEEVQLVDGSNLALTFIDKLLADNELSLYNCSYIAFVNGPGSFTGIRLGAAMVQALSFAKQLPIIIISKLELLAMQACNQFNATKVIVCLDALRFEMYVGQYYLDPSSKIVIATKPDCVYKQDKLKAEMSFDISEYVVICDQVDACKQLLTQAKDIKSVKELQGSAQMLALLANIKKDLAKSNPIGQVLPQYLKGPHISVPKN